ncbi:MAG: hypothetical protein ACOC1X_01240 [Promethearchaeota archaeon]
MDSKMFPVTHFTIEQEERGFVVQIEIKNESLSNNYSLLDFAINHPVILNIEDSPKFILIKLEHILNVEDIHITPDFVEMWDYNNSSATTEVEYIEGVRIDGIAEKCIVTENKDEVTKELI